MKNIDSKKQKMQNVSLRDVDEFLEILQADELKIKELLRKIIFARLPHVTKKLACNVAFYKHHKNFCFIWPLQCCGAKQNRMPVFA